LEILVGFHPIDRFTQFVQIANGVAVTIGIKKPPHGFSHDVELIDGQVASVPIQALEIIQGSSAVFGRRSSASAEAKWKSAVWIKRQSSLQPNVQLPIDHEVVFIAEALAATQTETRKRHPSGIFPEDNAAKTRNPIGRAMNKEAVQMFATPAEGILKDFVEFGDTGCAYHEQSPPHQRTHAAEHYAKLINRNGRYRRFRHANSLSKAQAYSLDPPESPALASVRHPNVASVFHLGRTGDNYFYAMEFVEGETLENLIKRSGRLDVKLALEIAAQVAAGLAAVHEQHLVHRDIKPTNIMVKLKEGGGVTAKIIDLGLAKTLDESASEAGISSPGAFAGTPEFASPEQFAGVGVDIRSDLYSLGVTLWEMVTGHVMFRGSPAEVMYQHQHAQLPVEQLEGVPQPVVALFEALLDKDPARRFQDPTELLKAVPTVTGALKARRRINRQSLQKTLPAALCVGTRKPSARLALDKISLARLPVTGSELFGREEVKFQQRYQMRHGKLT